MKTSSVKYFPVYDHLIFFSIFLLNRRVPISLSVSFESKGKVSVVIQIGLYKFVPFKRVQIKSGNFIQYPPLLPSKSVCPPQFAISCRTGLNWFVCFYDCVLVPGRSASAFPPARLKGTKVKPLNPTL